MFERARESSETAIAFPRPGQDSGRAVAEKMFHVVVLGAGFGGLIFSKAFRHPRARVMLADRKERQRRRSANPSEARLNAQADRSPGVLLASGCIAGILIAFMGGVLVQLTTSIDTGAVVNNPFDSEAAWNGHRSDPLTLVPFLGLVGFLHLVARGRIMQSLEAWH